MIYDKKNSLHIMSAHMWDFIWILANFGHLMSDDQLLFAVLIASALLLLVLSLKAPC